MPTTSQNSRGAPDRWVLALLVAIGTGAGCLRSETRDARYARDEGPTPAPVEGPRAGTLSIPIGEELASDITAALVEGGLTAEQANAVSMEVIASGVLAVEASASLWQLLEGSEKSPLEVSAPKVAGAFVAALDTERAGLSEELRRTAIGLIVSATFKFAGTKSLSSSARPALLGEIAQSVVAKTQEASLSANGMVDAIGLVADAAFGGMVNAGISADQISQTAQVMGSKIGEGVGGVGLSDAAIPQALGNAAEKASTALGRLSLTDASETVASTTQGFVAGLAASPTVSREIKNSALAEVPKGVSAAIPAWMPAEQLASAVDKVTTSTVATYVEKLSPNPAELATSLPLIAAGSVTGLTKSGVSNETMGSGQLATRPLQAIMNKLDTVVSAPDSRLAIVQNTLAKSISALGSGSTSSMATNVAPKMVSQAFEIATTGRSKFNVSSSDETKVTSFFDSMVKGAIDGIARLGTGTPANSANTAAAASSAILSKTMDAAVSSLNTIYAGSGTSISSTLLQTIPVRTAQAAGEKLAKVLPPDDLNTTFAAATSQYLYNVQSIVATKATSVDTATLSQSITANSLASFSGAWNANKTDLQTAATALNNSLGTLGSRLDSKVIASVQSGSQAVVVAAAGGKAALPGCSTSTANADLVACSKVDGANCPTAIANANGYRLTWSADASGETCFLYRELIVVAASVGAQCGANSDYVYGIGCRPSVPTAPCPTGQKFVYGVGCQETTFFCPVGQKLSTDKGCVEDTTVYTCPAGQRRNYSGTCEDVIPVCAAGFAYNSVTRVCVATSSTPLCPPGLTFINGEGCKADTSTASTTCAAGFYRSASGECRSNGTCDLGSFWDPTAQTCRSASACASPNIWNASTNMCSPPDALTAKCVEGQIWNGSSCQSCADGTTWDATAKLCRSVGSCPAGSVFNFDTNTCVPTTVTTCSSTATTPDTPSFNLVSGLVGGVQLNWSGTADGYILVRKNVAGQPVIPLADGRSYDARSTVSGSDTNTGLVVFRGPGTATSFTDFEARDSATTYDYELTSVNFNCNGPKYAAAPALASVRPLAPVIDASVTVIYGTPGNFSVAPMPPTEQFPTGLIQATWSPALASISGNQDFSQPANQYVLLRRDPVDPPPPLPTLTAAALATATIGTLLTDGWRIVYIGPNPSFSDRINYQTGYIYTVAAVYRTSTATGSIPVITAFVPSVANPVAQVGGTTPSFVSVQLSGPVGDRYLNQFELANRRTDPLLGNLVADATATKSYALVETTSNPGAACDPASTFVANPIIADLSPGSFNDGSKYRICVRLTSGGQHGYGLSPEFGVDLTPPTLSLGSGQSATISASAQTQLVLESTGAEFFQWGSNAPSKVMFDAPNALSPKVTATANGTYQLYLKARDAAQNAATLELTLVWSIPTDPVLSSMTVEGPPIVFADECVPFRIRLGNLMNTATPVSVFNTISQGTISLFSDEGCYSLIMISTLSIPADTDTRTFYVKTSPAAYDTASITASTTGLSPQSISFQVVDLYLGGAAADGMITESEWTANSSDDLIETHNSLVKNDENIDAYFVIVPPGTQCQTSPLAWQSHAPHPRDFTATGSYEVCVKLQQNGIRTYGRSPEINVTVPLGGAGESPPTLSVSFDPHPPIVTNLLAPIISTYVAVNGASANATYTWEKESGPGDVTFSGSTDLHPQITLTEPGPYELKLTVTDGAHTASGTLIIKGVERALMVENPMRTVDPNSCELIRLRTNLSSGQSISSSLYVTLSAGGPFLYDNDECSNTGIPSRTISLGNESTMTVSENDYVYFWAKYPNPGSYNVQAQVTTPIGWMPAYSQFYVHSANPAVLARMVLPSGPINVSDCIQGQLILNDAMGLPALYTGASDDMLYVKDSNGQAAFPPSSGTDPCGSAPLSQGAIALNLTDTAFPFYFRPNSLSPYEIVKGPGGTALPVEPLHLVPVQGTQKLIVRPRSPMITSATVNGTSGWISWQPSPDASGYLVLMNTSQAVTWQPTDLADYSTEVGTTPGADESKLIFVDTFTSTSFSTYMTPLPATLHFAVYSYRLFNSQPYYSIVPSQKVTPTCASLTGGTWVQVSGDSRYNTGDFCVQKYTASQLTGTPTSTPLSAPESTPWVNINQAGARAACTALGQGYHLITNPEWMTIATSLAWTPSNWSGSVLGSGSLNRGHSDSAPSQALAADPIDSNACAGTGQTCSDLIWNSQRRTFRLPNGQILWDFAGNVSQWVDNNNANAKPSPQNGWAEYPSITGTTSLPKSALIPSNGTFPWWNNSWYSSQNIGQFYPGPNGSGGAMVRGGSWNQNGAAGIFGASLSMDPSATSSAVGFRCAWTP